MDIFEALEMYRLKEFEYQEMKYRQDHAIKGYLVHVADRLAIDSTSGNFVPVQFISVDAANNEIAYKGLSRNKESCAELWAAILKENDKIREEGGIMRGNHAFSLAARAMIMFLPIIFFLFLLPWTHWHSVLWASDGTVVTMFVCCAILVPLYVGTVFFQTLLLVLMGPRLWYDFVRRFAQK